MKLFTQKPALSSTSREVEFLVTTFRRRWSGFPEPAVREAAVAVFQQTHTPHSGESLLQDLLKRLEGDEKRWSDV